ncbi:MAG: alpha/beta hydrolase-fold protein [Acidobacteriota bacterium]
MSATGSQARWLVLTSMLLMAISLVAQNGPRGFTKPLPTEELQKLPQTKGAIGDQQRHYYFTDAKQEMPYHLYVPKSYKPGKKMPLVVALHGYNGNHDYFFALVNNLPELCEKYGFIFVAPMGYSIGGWYGAPLSIPPGGGKGKAKGPELTPAEAQRERDLSEKDTMNVVEMVSKEYTVDPNRTFLMGHSMGGMGAYFLGQKYASKWAAVAPMSGTMAGADYHLDRLKKVPMLVSVGETETATADNAKAQVEEMKKLGMSAQYLEIPQGTHMSMIPPTVPQIFAFFAQHKRK